MHSYFKSLTESSIREHKEYISYQAALLSFWSDNVKMMRWPFSHKNQLSEDLMFTSEGILAK